MDFVEFIKENISNKYKFNLSDELSYVFEKDKDNIVIRISQGDQYRKGVIHPITIFITTKNANKTFAVWSQFVKDISDKDYLDGTENYYMLFQTPYVSQTFDEIKNNYYHTVTVFGTIVVTKGILDIKKATIDGVEVDINEMSFQLVNQPSLSHTVAGGNLSKTTIETSVLTFNINTFLANYGSLSLKLKKMRKGEISGDTAFTVVFTFVDESIETYLMKLTTQSIVKTRGAISLLSLAFAH